MTSVADTQKQGSLLRKILVIAIPIGIVLGFILLTVIIVAMNKKPEERGENFNPLAVMGGYAVQDDVVLSVQAQGEARPQTEIDLVPEVGGKIVYVSPNFIEGGIFKKGEVMVRIDPSDYRVAVVRAEAEVAQAEQTLVREIAEGEIALRDYEELGTGTPSDLALRKPQRQQAEATLQAAKAELSRANLQLERTRVVAPFDGRVMTKNSDVGKYVGPGSVLGRIFSTRVIEVRLPLTDNDLSKMDLPVAYSAESRETAPVVKLSAVIGGEVQNWVGQIMRTDSTFDTQTRALYAFAEVVDPYGTGASQNGVPLAPGMFVEAEITGKEFDDVIVLPREGLRPGNAVYVVDDKGIGEVRQVSVLDTSPDRAVLRSGIDPGELIVLSPVEESRLALTMKVLDVTDPETVLVDPPKPDWLIKKEQEQANSGSDDADESSDEDSEGGSSGAGDSADGTE